MNLPVLFWSSRAASWSLDRPVSVAQKSEHKQLIISIELKMSVTYNQSTAGVKYQIDEIK